nr:MAG TPA: hypothetical protein [Caudoviricetes sp.]
MVGLLDLVRSFLLSCVSCFQCLHRSEPERVSGDTATKVTNGDTCHQLCVFECFDICDFHLLYSVLVVDEVNIIGSKVIVNYSLQKIDKKKSRLGQGRDKTGEQRDGAGGDLSIVGLVSGVNLYGECQSHPKSRQLSHQPNSQENEVKLCHLTALPIASASCHGLPSNRARRPAVRRRRPSSGLPFWLMNSASLARRATTSPERSALPVPVVAAITPAPALYTRSQTASNCACVSEWCATESTAATALAISRLSNRRPCPGVIVCPALTCGP